MGVATTVTCDGCGTPLPGTAFTDCIAAVGTNSAGVIEPMYFGEVCGCATKLRDFIPSLKPA